jgi:preprotein translocase subunit SecG
MNDLNSILPKLYSFSKGLLRFMSKYRMIVILLFSSIAIVLALMQTRSYLNPTRDETIYNELGAGINYKGIDESIVEKLQSTQSDEEIQVDAILVPDRKNPFNE